MITALFATAFATDIPLVLPAGVTKGEVSIRVVGRDPTSIRCRSGKACVVRDVPEDRAVFIELITPDERWTWVLTSRDPRPPEFRDVWANIPQKPDVVRFVDLDGQPLMVVDGFRYAASDGTIRASPKSGGLRLLNYFPLSELDLRVAGNVVTVPVRHVPNSPGHRLYATDEPFDPYGDLTPGGRFTEWFGYALPVGSWTEDWIDDEGARRRLWTVPPTGALTVEEVELEPVTVTWTPVRGLETLAVEDDSRNARFNERHWPLYVETEPGRGAVHPLKQEPQLVSRGPYAAFWKPGQAELHLPDVEPYRIRCIGLNASETGLKMTDLFTLVAPDADLHGIRRGWVLTEVDGQSTTGWTPLHLWAFLATEPRSSPRQMRFETPSGPKTLTVRPDRACTAP